MSISKPFCFFFSDIILFQFGNIRSLLLASKNSIGFENGKVDSLITSYSFVAAVVFSKLFVNGGM